MHIFDTKSHWAVYHHFMIILFYDHLYIGLKSCGWPGAAIVGNQGRVTVIVFFVCLSLSLLPPKLQRRGLVFERKLVTMEREWWVTTERINGYYVWLVTIEREEWVTMKRDWWVTMIVHEGLPWSVYRLVKYMGHTSRWQFWVQWTTVIWRWYVTPDNDAISARSLVIFIIELGI